MNRDPTVIVPRRVRSFRGPRLECCVRTPLRVANVGPLGAARAPRMDAAANAVPDDPLEYRDRLAKAAARALSQALGADAAPREMPSLSWV